MPIESSSVSLPDASTPTAGRSEPLTPSSDERWAAWQARGAAHDRKVRRRAAIVAPVVAVVAAAILYALVR